MLSVANKPIKLRIIILNVVMLSVMTLLMFLLNVIEHTLTLG
jgi:hypothetical protein